MTNDFTKLENDFPDGLSTGLFENSGRTCPPNVALSLRDRKADERDAFDELENQPRARVIAKFKVGWVESSRPTG